jgi:hypothetical protein
VTWFHVFVRQLKFIWWWHVDACCGQLIVLLTSRDRFVFPDLNLAQQDLLTSLLRVLGYVPEQEATAGAWERQRVDACRFEVEAIRDAAADSSISLGAIMCGAQHGSTHPAKKIPNISKYT